MSENVTCKKCKGKGKYIYGYLLIMPQYALCTDCNGTGKIKKS